MFRDRLKLDSNGISCAFLLFLPREKRIERIWRDRVYVVFVRADLGDNRIYDTIISFSLQVDNQRNNGMQYLDNRFKEKLL